MDILRLLNGFDTDLLIKINGWNSEETDRIMIWITGKYTWIPFYVWLLFVLFRRFKKVFPVIICTIFLLIGLADRISSGVLKPVFQRLRPCHELALEGKLHLQDGCGGLFGFVSSHAANTFAVAFFIWMLVGSKRSWLWLLLWPVVVSYSRVYLAAHYPGDVLGGMVLGGVLAIVLYRLYVWVIAKWYAESIDY